MRVICYDGHIKVNLFAQQICLYAKPTNRARDFWQGVTDSSLGIKLLFSKI